MSARTEKRFLSAAAGSVQSVTDFAESFPKIPALVVQHTRCGRARCRCQVGQRHGPYHYLRWREGSVQRRRYVRARDVPVVQTILAQRRAHRRAERLELSLALRTWSELSQWVADCEAHLRAEQEEA